MKSIFRRMIVVGAVVAAFTFMISPITAKAAKAQAGSRPDIRDYIVDGPLTPLNESEKNSVESEMASMNIPVTGWDLNWDESLILKATVYSGSVQTSMVIGTVIEAIGPDKSTITFNPDGTPNLSQAKFICYRICRTNTVGSTKGGTTVCKAGLYRGMDQSFTSDPMLGVAATINPHIIAASGLGGGLNLAKSTEAYRAVVELAIGPDGNPMPVRIDKGLCHMELFYASKSGD